MGLFDKFKKRFERVGQEDRKPKHVVKEDRGGLTKAELESAKAHEGGQPAKGKPEKAAEKQVKREDTRQAPRILLRPLITEKATQLSSYRQYAFVVHPKANKIEIRKAIRALYGVEPQAVNVMRVPGKDVRFGRVRGRTNSWKKAIVTLKPGEKIDVAA